MQSPVKTPAMMTHTGLITVINQSFVFAIS